MVPDETSIGTAPHSASHTMRVAAMSRAVHALRGPEPKLLHDPSGFTRAEPVSHAELKRRYFQGAAETGLPATASYIRAVVDPGRGT